jgi:hypothetical protein
MLSAVILLLLLVLFMYFWYSHSQIKEIALQAARDYCRLHHYQLLDDTIDLNKIGVHWRNGQLRRVFNLRYYDSVDDIRHCASIVLYGQAIVSIGSVINNDNVVHLTRK